MSFLFFNSSFTFSSSLGTYSTTRYFVVIRLKKKAPQLSKHKILEQLCEEFQLDSNIFKTIYRHTTQEEKIVRDKINFFVGEYLKELEKLASAASAASAVDRI